MNLKFFRILIWAAICLLLDKLLIFWWKPSEIIYSYLFFIIPFILLGFQHEYPESNFKSTFCWIPVLNKKRIVRVMTFWAIPIGEESLVEVEWMWYHDVIPSQALKTIVTAIEILFPVVIKKIVSGLSPLKIRKQM